MSVFLNRAVRVFDQKYIHLLMGDFNGDALNHEANQRLWDILES